MGKKALGTRTGRVKNNKPPIEMPKLKSNLKSNNHLDTTVAYSAYLDLNMAKRTLQKLEILSDNKEDVLLLRKAIAFTEAAIGEIGIDTGKMPKGIQEVIKDLKEKDGKAL